MKTVLHRILISLVVLIAAASSALAQTPAEVCGNGLDDNGNDLVDEHCMPYATTGQCPSPLACEEGMVSPSTGSLRYTLPPDVSARVPFGPSLSFTRLLLSQAAPGGSAPAYRKPMGDRWSHVFMSWLDKKTAPNPDQIILRLPRGQEVLCKWTSTSGGYNYYNACQSGFHFTHLRENQSSGNYELKLLTGEVYVYGSTGKLGSIRDTLATPNVLSLAYDGTTGQLLTVTDSHLTRRLLFGYTSSLLTSVAFQIDYGDGTWVTQHTTSYAYTGTNLTSVTMGGQLAQTNVYDGSGNVTQIQDGGSNVLVAFSYDSATAGKTVRVDTPRGMVGYDFNSSRSNCSAKTVLYFHRANTTSCTNDSDCGTGNLCGGKTGTGATGVCFRGARCLTVSSPSEDIITTITAFAGSSESCDGACLDAIDHVFNTSGGKLDLTAVKDPTNYYTTKEFNTNGLPTTIVYGDNNTDPKDAGGSRVVYMTYDANFPGRVAEIRRQSDLDQSTACSPGNGSSCAITQYVYTTEGLLDLVRHIGNTKDATDTTQRYQYETDYSYDSYGRVTSIDGPLSGTADTTIFEYWVSTDPFKNGFLQNVKRQIAPSGTPDYLVSSSSSFDFWGNPTAISDPDGTLTCLTFDSARGHMTERRETMNGQSSCTSHSSDLVTSYLRDSALRLTKLTKPDGSCMLYEYDSRGRLLKTRRRDDCNAASSGDREEYTYSADGLVTKIETFNASNTVTKRQELTYFDSRRIEKVLNPVDTAKWTGFTYEARGLIETVAAKDSSTNYNKGEWMYDAEGRVANERRYTSGSSFDTWALLFDWIGNQRQVTDGDTKVTTSKRDDLGRVVKLDSPDLGGYPTLRVYDNASRLVTIVERAGGSGSKTHTFTYDPIGRPVESQYAGDCSGPSDIPDIVRVYDASPGSCPAGTSCVNTRGRLAYVTTKLMCDSAQTDKTLEQKTWFGYDSAGRLTHEYIEDDVTPTPRTAAHVYSWTKSGTLSQVTLPSSAVIGWTYGSAGSNSDTDRITAMWRTSTSTPIADEILWEPYGPLKQYNQQNTSSTYPMRTVISRNLAHRITKLEVELQAFPNTDLHYVVIDEDQAGRTKKRQYFTSPTGIEDSYFKYDLQDRVLCETTNSVTSCPTSGTNIKNSHTGSPPFTAAGDWKQLKRPIPGSSDIQHDFTLASGTHQIAEVEQPTTLQTTTIRYNTLGNRSEDDNEDTLTYDERMYSYDARRNVTAVTGKFKTGGAWHDYSVVSAFDHKNRRVFKSFTDVTASKTATWFFYYDALDRLTEIRHTPDVSSSSTYSTHQLFWLGQRLVLYWQTDYPSAMTTKRYVGTDETGRPIDMICWGSGGANCPRVWSINPDAWGFDEVLVGSNVFQPIVFAGQYRDDETVAWRDDGTTAHRPGIVLNGFRTYDSWTGAYLQVDPKVDATWSTYVYALSNPVGRIDRDGRTSCTTVDGQQFCWDDEVIEVSGTAPEEVKDPGPNGLPQNPNCPTGFCTGPDDPRPPTPPQPIPCSGPIGCAELEPPIFEPGDPPDDTTATANPWDEPPRNWPDPSPFPQGQPCFTNQENNNRRCKLACWDDYSFDIGQEADPLAAAGRLYWCLNRCDVWFVTRVCVGSL